MALQVLLIAGLLADEGDGSADWAFAEDGAGPPSTIGSAAAMRRSSPSRLRGSRSAIIAATALAGLRCAGMTASLSTISLTRDGAVRTSSGMAEVSGRFFQYLFAM